MSRLPAAALRGLGAAAVALPLGVLAAGLLTGTLGWLAMHFVVATAFIGIAVGLGTYLGVANQPGNRVLRITALSGVLIAVEVVGYLAAALALPSGLLDGDMMRLAPRALPPIAAWGLWVGYATWLPALGVLLTYGLLWFPDGERPTGRWRGLEPMAAVGMLLAAVGYAVGTWPTSSTPYVTAVAGPDGSAGLLMDVGRALTVAAVFGAIASVFVRHRRATGQRRQQLRVVGICFGLLGVSLTVTGAAIALGLGFGPGLWMSTVGAPLFFGGYVTALLRYRIYDIDVVISRTLVVAGSGAFITGVYVAVVVGVGRLVGAGEADLWLSVGATAIVSVAFQPVRQGLRRAVNRLVYGDRATPYEVLSRTSRASAAGSAEAVLGELTTLLEDATGAAVRFGVVAGDRVAPIGDRPAPDLDVAEHVEWIVHGDRRLGVVTLVPRRGEALSEQHLELVARIASAAGALLHNESLTAELRDTVAELEASRGRLLATADAARRMIEAELRSGPEEVLTGLCLRLSTAARAAEDTAPRTAEVLTGLVDDATRAIATVRQLASGAYPPLLESEGLVVALRTRTSGMPFPVSVQGAGLRRHHPEVEAAAYFCVLEALQNAAKHADPSAVDVRLVDDAGRLRFEVRDDGPGFDVSAAVGGTGLRNMSDRLDALGGRLQVSSTTGVGTVVAGELPTHADAAVSAGRSPMPVRG